MALGLQPEEEILALEFGIGVEDSDFVVGVGLTHGHVLAAGIEQGRHLVVMHEVAHHEHTLGVKESLQHRFINRSIDKPKKVIGFSLVENFLQRLNAAEI